MTDDISPEVFAAVRKQIEKEGVCQQTILSYHENRLVKCERSPTHYPVQHAGVDETDGVLREWCW